MWFKRSRDDDNTSQEEYAIRPRKRSWQQEETATRETNATAELANALFSSTPACSLASANQSLSLGLHSHYHHPQDPTTNAWGATSALSNFGNIPDFSLLPSSRAAVNAVESGMASLPQMHGLHQTLAPESELLLASGNVNPLLFSLNNSRLLSHVAEDLLRQEALSKAVYWAKLQQIVNAQQQQSRTENLVPSMNVATTQPPSHPESKFDAAYSESDVSLLTSYTPNVESKLTTPSNLCNNESHTHHLALGIPEDQNWLSEFHCFVRDNLIEACNAFVKEPPDASTGKMPTHQQVGIRCRYCAHVDRELRAKRSSAYPSSTGQLYQSFTMMLRDHFGKCKNIPNHHKKEFSRLKGNISQGSTDAKQYWEYSASKLGFKNSEYGIIITDESKEAAKNLLPFGWNTSTFREREKRPSVPMVQPQDSKVLPPFLYTLFSLSQRVHLLPSERRRNRRGLPVGLPGFGCKYCVQVGWLGQSRTFPVRRRTIRDKANDLYEHMCRCRLCPLELKVLLKDLKKEDLRTQTDSTNTSLQGFDQQEKRFFNALWSKLKRDDPNKFSMG